MIGGALDWLSDECPVGALVGGGLLLLVGLVGLLVWASVVEERDWQAYSASHRCVAVGVKEGSLITTYDGKTGYSPDQTIYRCDGGELRIR